MLNWLRGKVSRDSLNVSRDASPYETVSKGDDDDKNTLVVVRDGAVPKMTLESNELQLLRDIPEFKPLLDEAGAHQTLSHTDVRSLLSICKIYQEHLHSCSEDVSTHQHQITARMKEVDMAIKVLMDRLTERQKAYAKAAEHLHKTSDLTQSLRKLRYNVKETEEMLRLLNEELPENLRLEPYHFVESSKTPG